MNIKRTKQFISIIAGGTGGHIYPAIALLSELNKIKNIYFITDLRGYNFLKKDDLFSKDINLKILILKTTSPFKKGVLNKFLFFYNFIHSFLKIIFFFIKEKPCVQIGFGGYITILPCLIGKLFFKIEYYIHEQNAVMGRANRILENFSSNTFIPFNKILPYKHLNKRVYSGTPVRSKINALTQSRKKKIISFNILIFGGSLGSEFFSSLLVNSIINLNKNVKKRVFFHHQVLNERVNIVKKLYKENGVNADVRSFFLNIEKLYNKANLIVCRAGGSSIAEILFLKKPCILVPLKDSLDNHQEFNSHIIKNNKLGWIINENRFKEKSFNKLIEKIIFKKSVLEQIKQNYGLFSEKNKLKTQSQSSSQIISKTLKKHMFSLEKINYDN